MKKIFCIALISALVGLISCGMAFAVSLDEMKTPAEASNYTKTSSSKEVLDFCNNVAKQSGGRIRVEHIGYSPMGKQMIVMVIGNPAPASPEKVGKDKVVCYLNNNIHSGEIEGKEASLILAREIAQGKHDDILKDVVIIINPNHNLDGNDMLGEHRIDSQPEPKLVGSRLTAQGLNLNRDFTKLEQPENKAIMKVMKKWQPSLILDAHTTNGSRIRHAVTYHWSYNANTDKELSDFNSKVFIP
ncbi:MAG: M14 family zinc carboxypeptidase, partial [Cloacibacillus sp.]